MNIKLASFRPSFNIKYRHINYIKKWFYVVRISKFSVRRLEPYLVKQLCYDNCVMTLCYSKRNGNIIFFTTTFKVFQKPVACMSSIRRLFWKILQNSLEKFISDSIFWLMLQAVGQQSVSLQLHQERLWTRSIFQLILWHFSDYPFYQIHVNIVYQSEWFFLKCPKPAPSNYIRITSGIL